MRLLLAVLCSIALSVSAASMTLFQTTHTTDQHMKRPSTIRVFDLGFNSYTPANRYEATLCDIPVDLLEISRSVLVVRLSARPAKPVECLLSVFMKGGGSLVHSVPGLELRGIDSLTDTVVVDVVPSFFQASAPATLLTVAGTNLDRVKAVRGRDFPDVVCSGLRAGATLLTCTLPAVSGAAARATALVLEALDKYDDPLAEIMVQPVATRAAVVDASQHRLQPRKPLTLALSESFAAADAFPWRAVLTDRKGRAVQSAAAGPIEWSKDRREATFSLACPDCEAGEYGITLGDAVSGDIAGAVLASNTTIVVDNEDLFRYLY